MAPNTEESDVSNASDVVDSKKPRANNSAANKLRTRKPEAKARARRHTNDDKQKKIAIIEAHVAGGGTLKDAVFNAGISDETYYKWKRAAASSMEELVSAELDDPEFGEFVQLEEENRRLRRLVVDRLRKENATLRKRLGMPQE